MARVSAAVLVLVLACSINFFQVAESAGLVYNYYAGTCPNAEKIIKNTVYKLYEKKGNIATSLIRMGFHDCFNVRNRFHTLDENQQLLSFPSYHISIGWQLRT